MNDKNNDEVSEEYKAFLEQKRKASEWGGEQRIIEVNKKTGDVFHKIEDDGFGKEKKLDESSSLSDDKEIENISISMVDDVEVEKAFSEMEKDLESEMMKNNQEVPIPQNQNINPVPVMNIVEKNNKLEIPKKENNSDFVGHGGFWRRSAARMLDYWPHILIGLVLSIVFYSANNDSVFLDVFIFFTFILNSGYNIYLYFSKGQTIGDQIFGMKMVDYSGQKPSGGRLFGRYIAKIISIYSVALMVFLYVIISILKNPFQYMDIDIVIDFFFTLLPLIIIALIMPIISILMIVFTKKKQALYDKWSKTYMIVEEEKATWAVWTINIIFFALPFVGIIISWIIFQVINPDAQINNAKDAIVKTNVSGATMSMMMYWNKNNYSYDGACSVVSYDLNCNDNEDGWVVYSELNNGSYSCIDSSGSGEMTIFEEPEIESISCK